MQRADIFAPLVRNNTVRPIQVDHFTVHAQPGRTHRPPIGAKLAAFSLVPALFSEGNRSKSTWIIGPIEIFMHVPGIKGGVKCSALRTVAQALLHLSHQWEKVAGIRLVKGLGHFGQDIFAPPWNFDHYYT